MTAILDGILNEIASVALLPRNDVGNSRIPSIRDPPVKLGDDRESEILGSSPRMTKKVKSRDDTRLREF